MKNFESIFLTNIHEDSIEKAIKFAVQTVMNDCLLHDLTDDLTAEQLEERRKSAFRHSPYSDRSLQAGFYSMVVNALIDTLLGLLSGE